MKKKLILFSILGLILNPLSALAEIKTYWEDLGTGQVQITITGLNPGESYPIFRPLAKNTPIPNCVYHYKISLSLSGDNLFYQGTNEVSTTNIPILNNIRCSGGNWFDDGIPTSPPDAFISNGYTYFKISPGIPLWSEGHFATPSNYKANGCGMIRIKQDIAARPLNNIYVAINYNNSISYLGLESLTQKRDIPICKKIGLEYILYYPN